MRDTSDLAALDATATADLIRSGDLSATEAVSAAIARAEAVDGELHAIIHPRFEAALADAAGPLGDGPFAGVPMVVKDLDGMDEGEPYHGGSRFLQRHGYIAPASTELNARLRRAGLISIGRTNSPELGLVTTTEPDSAGPTHNPWDTTRSAGGSSGGSAAAVASGIVPIGHAGDGGGSIRIPASECGLFGLKPSRGRITVGPEAGEAWAGLVARLAVTRSVRDTAALLDAVAGPGIGDPYWAPPPARPYRDEVGADPGRLRIGFVTDLPGGAPTDPNIALATRATADLLTQLGHHVDEAHPPTLGDAEATGHFLVAYGAWVARSLDQLGELVGTPVTEGDVEAGTWLLATGGREVTAPQYLAALDGLHAASRVLVAWWLVDGYDLLLTPTIPELPPTLGQFRSDAENPLNGVFRSTPFASFTAPFNITGQPAMSVPLHQSKEGLPIGMQFVAAPAREDVLFRLAGQLEEASPWADRRPAVWAGDR